MLQTKKFENSFLYKLYCSDPDCSKNRTSFSNFESQRCPACDEPAKLPNAIPLYETISATKETEMIRNKAISEFAGVKNLYMKDEGQNPTGSFKDRGSFTAYLFHILQTLHEGMGVADLVVGTVSTGNMAISTAWMGNMLKVRNFVVVHANTSQEKLSLIEKAAGKIGTTIFAVDGEYSEFHKKVYDACKELRSDNQLIFAELTDDVFRILGYSTLFAELYQQCAENKVNPNFIIVPGASGALFRVAVWSLSRLKAAGLIKEIPKVVLVQENGGDPIVQSYKQGLDTSQRIEMEDGLVASAINVSNSRSGSEVLRIIKNSGHMCISVDSDEINDARDFLFQEKVFAECAASASVAAAKKLMDEGIISQKDVVVSLLTGREVEKRNIGEKSNTCEQINCKLNNLSDAIVNRFSN